MIPRSRLWIGSLQAHFPCGSSVALRITSSCRRFCDAMQSAAGGAETERKGFAADSHGQQFGPVTEVFPWPVDTHGALRATTRMPGC